jgi:hypothetical protein
MQEDDDGVEERWIELAFTWSSKPFALKIAESDMYIGILVYIYLAHNLL